MAVHPPVSGVTPLARGKRGAARPAGDGRR